jgi:hypothetical protein
MEETKTVMRVVSLGRAARSKAGLKVRQPLATATAFVLNGRQAEGVRRLADQVIDELNVKAVEVKALDELFTETWERPKDLIAKLPEGAALAMDDPGYAVGLDNITPG